MPEFIRPILPEYIYRASGQTPELDLTHPKTPGMLLKRMEKNINGRNPNPSEFIVDLTLLDQSQTDRVHITDQPATRNLILQIGERKDIYEAVLKSLQQLHRKLQSPGLDKTSDDAKDTELLMQTFLRNSFLLGMHQSDRHPAIAGVVNALAQQYFPDSYIDTSSQAPDRQPAAEPPPVTNTYTELAKTPGEIQRLNAEQINQMPASTLLGWIGKGLLTVDQILQIKSSPDIDDTVEQNLAYPSSITMVSDLGNMETIDENMQRLSNIALTAIRRECQILIDRGYDSGLGRTTISIKDLDPRSKRLTSLLKPHWRILGRSITGDHVETDYQTLEILNTITGEALSLQEQQHMVKASQKASKEINSMNDNMYKKVDADLVFMSNSGNSVDIYQRIASLGEHIAKKPEYDQNYYIFRTASQIISILENEHPGVFNPQEHEENIIRALRVLHYKLAIEAEQAQAAPPAPLPPPAPEPPPTPAAASEPATADTDTATAPETTNPLEGLTRPQLLQVLQIAREQNERAL